jgi:hypothetical protein
MRTGKPGTLLVGLLLACAATGSAAQTADGRFSNAADCVRENASRIDGGLHCNERKPGDAVRIEHDFEITTRMEGIPIRTRQCKAEVALSYAQKNTLASVEGTIENATCGASSGSLVLSVRTATESGVLSTQEFTQAWMRDDAQPVAFSAEYPIGANVDLVRVRALRMTCSCAELPQAEATPQ